MTEKKKEALKKVGKGTLYTLLTGGAYLLAVGSVYGITRVLGKKLQTVDDTIRVRQTVADADPKDGTPLFIGS